MAPNLDCKMYEHRFPEVDSTVMIQVKSINADTCAYVSLVEYGGMEGMLSFTELSHSRIRSIAKVVRIGWVVPIVVLHVDTEKGDANLCRWRVSEDDVKACEERFSNSKNVHSILWHVAETMDIDLEAMFWDNALV